MTNEQFEKITKNASINILEEIEKECGENVRIDNDDAIVVLATVSYAILNAASKVTGTDIDKLINRLHHAIDIAKDEMSKPMKGFLGEFLEDKTTDAFVPKTIN